MSSGINRIVNLPYFNKVQMTLHPSQFPTHPLSPTTPHHMHPLRLTGS